MNYRFRPTHRFWESFYAVSSSQKESARRAWTLLKTDPFDPRLRSHKIHRLSAHHGRTIYSAQIEADLRVIFYLEGNEVVTVDVGSHDVYRG